MTNTVDAARVELLLSELRLPTFKLMWAKLAEQSRQGRLAGSPASLAALAERTRWPTVAGAASNGISPRRVRVLVIAKVILCDVTWTQGRAGDERPKRGISSAADPVVPGLVRRRQQEAEQSTEVRRPRSAALPEGPAPRIAAISGTLEVSSTVPSTARAAAALDRPGCRRMIWATRRRASGSSQRVDNFASPFNNL